MYPVRQDYISHNRPGTALSAEGAVCHSTATQGATDEAEQAYFDGANRSASAHAFIDWDSITETIPWNEKAWHAMSAANNRYIGVELCEPKDSDPDRFKKFAEVWKRGAWYFARMFVLKGWSLDELHSHKWVSETYHESDHTDPYGYFKKYGKTFGDFNDAVAAQMAAIKAGVTMQAEQPQATVKGGDFMPEVAVVYFSPADFSVALVFARANGDCAMYCRNAAPAVHADVKKAKKIFTIGGPALGLPGEVYISGDTAKDTLKKAVALL